MVRLAPAVDVAIETGEPMVGLIELTESEPRLTQQLWPLLPVDTVRLRGLALSCAENLRAEMLRVRPEWQLERLSFFREVSTVLAHHLRESSQSLEALVVLEDAIQACRDKLAQTEGPSRSKVQHDLAVALNQQAAAMSETGAYRQALAIGRESVEIFEQLDDQARLADALNELAALLNAEQLADEALQAARGSVRIRQELVDRGQTLLQRDLANSELTLAAILADCGYISESIQWAEKARDLLESLGSAESDAFILDMANAHSILATLWIDAAHNDPEASVDRDPRACYEAGFAAVSRAERLYRELMGTGSPGAALDLLSVLVHKSILETGLVRFDDAVSTAKEAVALTMGAGPGEGVSGRESRALAFHTLGNALKAKGPEFLAQAVPPLVEAATIYEQLFELEPEAYELPYAQAWGAVGCALAETGADAEAIPILLEVADRFLDLQSRRPDAFAGDLATLAHALGELLARNRGGDHAQGLAARLQRLAKAWPDGSIEE
jgi:tetratricopeptide (TPR) repeat protein